MNSSRSLASLAIVALTLLIVAGCGLMPFAPADTPIPAPTPTATPTPTPTPTPLPGVSKAEAERVVRDFFAAMDRRDYEGMVALTSAKGTEVSDGLIAEIRRNEQASNVTLQPRAETLEITRVEKRDQSTEVDVAFLIRIYANVGPLNLLARSSEGEATFIVERFGGEARIADITGGLRDLD